MVKYDNNANNFKLIYISVGNSLCIPYYPHYTWLAKEINLKQNFVRFL
jgi:hypothetical protein